MESQPIITSAKNIHMQNILTYKSLIAHTRNQHLTVSTYHDDLIDGRTVGHILVLLQTIAHKSLCTVHIQLFAGHSHLNGLYGVKNPDLRFPASSTSVLFQQLFVVGNRERHHMLQIMANLLHVLLHAPNVLVGLKSIKLTDTLDFDFR